jgi:quinol monooxygenase YgiN
MTDAATQPTEESALSVRVIAVWEASAAAQAHIEAILGALVPASLAEPGCQRFEVWNSPEVPYRYILIEDYAGPDARQAHVDSAHFTELVLQRASALLTNREVHVFHERVFHQVESSVGENT